MRVRLLVMMVAAMLAMVIIAAPALAAPGDSPIDADVTDTLANASPTDQIPVLIVAPGHLDEIQDALPTESMEEVPLVDAVAARLTPAQIDDLNSSELADDIQDIQLDDSVVGLGWTDYLSFTNLAIGLNGIEPPAGNGPDGAGVNVAVLDSGVSPQEDLSGDEGYRVVAFKDFVQGKRTAYDDAGHGTFVAGLIAGNGSSSRSVDEGGQATRQYRGVAPKAGIVSLKVLNSTGQGRESDVIRAIAWAIQNRTRYNIRVLNISLGGDVVAPTRFDPMAMAVEAAWKSGITVVAAAGNTGEFGPGGILSPGNDPYIITVGASDTRQTAAPDDDAICYYSAVGPTLFDEYAKPDVIAPGNRNISLRVPGSYVDTNWPENRIAVSQYIPGAPEDADPAYFMLSGTSTSTPVVSGLVALMLSEDPTLSPDDVKLRLMNTAQPLPEASDLQQGAGVVNAAAALSSSLQANGPTLSRDLGDGTTIIPKERYAEFGYYAWDKFRWTKFNWTKFRWTRTGWTKFRWTDVDWDKFRWTKFNWTKFNWTKFNWTKFRWTGTEWTKFRWTGVDAQKFNWTSYEWLKFRWTTLIEGQ